MKRLVPVLSVVLVVVAAIVVWRRSGGIDRDAYVKANEAMFRQVPLFPGAKLREEVSSASRDEEDGPIVGYGTRYDFDLPEAARVGDVASFYRKRLEPEWRLVERLDGPVLNFCRGRAFVSINLESWRAHQLEVSVDHDSGC